MSEEWKSRVQRLADFWFWGYMIRKFQGAPLKPDHILVFCQASFLMTLSQVGVLTLAPSSTPGFPVHHQLLELAQTHVHWGSDSIQPSHPLSSPSVFSLSQHQGLFKWLSGQSIGASPSASILPMNIQGWFPLGFTGWISLESKGLSRAFSNRTVQKYIVLSYSNIQFNFQLFCIFFSILFNSHPYGRKWRGTKDPLDEGGRGQWKNWLEIQHLKN